MLNRPPIYRQAGFWLVLIPIVLIAVWFYLFSAELIYTYTWWVNPEAFTARVDFSQSELNRSIAVIVLSLTAFPVYLVFSLWTVSQFVLPVTQPTDRLNVFIRLLLFLTGRHGPAVFIREGILRGTPEEVQSSRPGVVFVDLNSALVLEGQSFIADTGGRVTAQERRRRAHRGLETGSDQPAPMQSGMVRVAGPGIVFTEAGERIRGVVSLRRQFRIQLNTHSITRDGFEVSAHIVAIFSLGEPEEVLRLGYFGERPDDIRSLQVDEGRKLLRGSRDELEHADKLEVHRFYQHHTRFNGFDIETPPAKARSLSPLSKL